MNDLHPPVQESSSKLQSAEFDQFAETYREQHWESIGLSGEDPDYFASYKVDYLSDRSGIGTGDAADLLDFGCGVGSALGHLRRRFPSARLHGTDVSAASIEIAGKHFPDTNFQIIQDEHLELGSASMDLAMAACVFHHIPPAEHPTWISELRRVLKPGGRLFVFEHNPSNPLTRKVVRECPFDRDAVLLPLAETRRLLREAGFIDLSSEYIVFFPRGLAALRPFERHLAWLPLGAQYVVSGRAPNT